MSKTDILLPFAVVTANVIFYRHAWAETLRKTWWWLTEVAS